MNINLTTILLLSSLIVIIHELGHFLVAKFVGVQVTEFNAGVGYNLFSFTKFGTKFSFNILPMGGSIRVFINKEPTAQEYRKMLFICLSGPAINIITGIIFLYADFYFLGVWSVFNGFGNMIPTGGSDGSHAIAILKELHKKGKYEKTVL
jgi:regulator of sigma E protease